MGWSGWLPYFKVVVNKNPEELGVYELGDASKMTVYYGSGKIRTKLLDHINKKECPMVRYYRFCLFATEEECKAREEELLKEYKQKHGGLPLYNERIG